MMIDDLIASAPTTAHRQVLEILRGIIETGTLRIERVEVREDTADVAALRAQIANLQQRVDELEGNQIADVRVTLVEAA